MTGNRVAGVGGGVGSGVLSTVIISEKRIIFNCSIHTLYIPCEAPLSTTTLHHVANNNHVLPRESPAACVHYRRCPEPRKYRVYYIARRLPCHTGMFYSLTSLVHSTHVHSTHASVDSRQFEFRVPAAAHICHMRPAFSRVLSQSHVMLFHNSARANDATIIPTSQWQSPDPTPLPRHVREPYSYSMSVHITPRQRPLIPPRVSQSERTCDARSSRTSHVATSFTLGPPQTSEGLLPLPHACFLLCMQAAVVGLQSEKGSARRANDPLDEWDMALWQCRRAKGRSAEGARGTGRST